MLLRIAPDGPWVSAVQPPWGPCCSFRSLNMEAKAWGGGGQGGHILQGRVQDATGWCEHWEPDLCLGSLRPPASQLTHGDSWSGPFFEILGDRRPYPHVLKIVRLPGLGSLDALVGFPSVWYKQWPHKSFRAVAVFSFKAFDSEM